MVFQGLLRGIFRGLPRWPSLGPSALGMAFKDCPGTVLMTEDAPEGTVFTDCPEDFPQSCILSEFTCSSMGFNSDRVGPWKIHWKILQNSPWKTKLSVGSLQTVPWDSLSLHTVPWDSLSIQTVPWYSLNDLASSLSFSTVLHTFRFYL